MIRIYCNIIAFIFLNLVGLYQNLLPAWKTFFLPTNSLVYSFIWIARSCILAVFHLNSKSKCALYLYFLHFLKIILAWLISVNDKKTSFLLRPCLLFWAHYDFVMSYGSLTEYRHFKIHHWWKEDVKVYQYSPNSTQLNATFLSTYNKNTFVFGHSSKLA